MVCERMTYLVLHEQRNHVQGLIFGRLVTFRTVMHEFIFER